MNEARDFAIRHARLLLRRVAAPEATSHVGGTDDESVALLVLAPTRRDKETAHILHVPGAAFDGGLVTLGELADLAAEKDGETMARKSCS